MVVYPDTKMPMMQHGNVQSADDWRSVLEPVVSLYKKQLLEPCFCGGAAFAGNWINLNHRLNWITIKQWGGLFQKSY